jgi:hypothetical protein
MLFLILEILQHEQITKNLHLTAVVLSVIYMIIMINNSCYLQLLFTFALEFKSKITSIQKIHYE